MYNIDLFLCYFSYLSLVMVCHGCQICLYLGVSFKFRNFNCSNFLKAHPRLAPSQSAYLCVFHGFVEWVVGIFDGTEDWFDLLHFLSGLRWWEF